jgi:hypothetical protein
MTKVIGLAMFHGVSPGHNTPLSPPVGFTRIAAVGNKAAPANDPLTSKNV